MVVHPSRKRPKDLDANFYTAAKGLTRAPPGFLGRKESAILWLSSAAGEPGRGDSTQGRRGKAGRRRKIVLPHFHPFLTRRRPPMGADSRWRREDEIPQCRPLVRKLSALDKIEASRELTRFYTHARFRISKDDFRRQFTDGANDGGIDYFNTEDSTHFAFQSEFSELPKGWPRARFSTRWRSRRMPRGRKSEPGRRRIR